MTEAQSLDAQAVATILADLRHRIEIERLLVTYCDLVDRLEVDELVALFTPDGLFDYGHGRVFEGRDALQSLFSGLETYAATSHHLSNVRIQIESDGRARADSVLYAFHRRAGDGEEVELWGRYFDELSLVNGMWLFRTRRLRAAAEKGTHPAPPLETHYELIRRRGRIG